MGSLEGFVVLKLPQYFLQRARKLAQNLLDSDSNLMRPPDTSPPPAPYLCHSRPPPSRRAFITLHSLALSRPSRCIASSLALIFVVSMVGRRGQRHRRIRRRRAGGGGRSHPSLSSSVATTTLHVARPPPLLTPSNICSRSRQHDSITAPAIVVAARPNVHPCELAEGRCFQRRPWRRPCPLHPRALPHVPPNNIVD